MGPCKEKGSSCSKKPQASHSVSAKHFFKNSSEGRGHRVCDQILRNWLVMREQGGVTGVNVISPGAVYSWSSCS